MFVGASTANYFPCMPILFRFLATLCLVSLLPAAWAQAPQFQWAGAGTIGFANVRPFVLATATDPSGHTVAALDIQRPLTLDGIAYGVPGLTGRQVLVRYDTTGHVTWAKVFHDFGGNHGYRRIEAIRTDAAGNVYVAGNFRYLSSNPGVGIVVDNDTLPLLPGNLDYFVIKYSPGGQRLWAVQGGICPTPGSYWTPAIHGMTVSEAGDVWITGIAHSDGFVENCYGGLLIPPNGYWGSFFVARLSRATGATQWVQSPRYIAGASLTEENFGAAVEVDAAGNSYVLGGGSGFRAGNVVMPVLRPDSLNSISSDTCFWLKFSPTGQCLAGRYLPAAGGSGVVGSRLAVGPDGNSYVLTDQSPDSLRIPPSPNSPALPYRDGGRRGPATLLRLDPAGGVDWARRVTCRYSLNYSDLHRYLATDAAGHLYLAGNYGLDTIMVGDEPLSLPPSQGGDGFLAILDAATGQPLHALTVGGRASEYVQAISVSPNGYVTVAGDSKSDTTLLGSEIAYGRVVRNGYKFFIGTSTTRYNLIRGSAFVDANRDGVQNGSEMGYPFGSVVELMPGPRHFATAVSGHYQAPVGLGTWQVELANPPLYHTVVNLGAPITSFSTFGNVGAGRSFALRPIAGRQDVQAFLSCSEARPGGRIHYGLTIRNIGTATIPGGALTLTVDSLLTFSSSNEPLTISGRTLTWAYDTLRAGTMHHYNAELWIPTPMPDPYILTAQATVTPLAGDLTPADNVAWVHEPVVPDPPVDSALVSFRSLTPQQVQDGEWLDYTVRFRNAQADTIYRVVVRDTLPVAGLRLGTLEVLAASHPFIWALAPGGVLEVRLNDIKLPGATPSQAGGTGFVHFRVRPQPGLRVGDEIRHRPYVQADFTAARPLNEAITRIENTPLGMPEPADLSATIWPNPANQLLHVRAQLPVGGAISVRLLDATGRVVTQRVEQAKAGAWHGQLSVEQLPAGLFLLDVQAGNSRFSRQLVIEAR